MTHSIKKLLIANRGEIACRVIAGARRIGIPTVAVYSEADRNARHAELADQSVCIGPALAAESYLNIAAVIAAAKQTGADAIHPGYGFLAENAEFARACADAGITFVGPSPEAIDLMGNKRQAKIRMIDAGVPCVPGYEGADQSDAALLAAADKIGVPIMVKAASGGGGRGMRLVEQLDDLAEAISSARSEAENAFGSGELILEKAVVNARHVEIQVFGDHSGNVVHLGERDCSIQRRHQKIVEEAPSPAVDEALRQQMGTAAVAAAAAVDYVGAGTVEFLLGADGEFYFLEMNTRLQVEHPVTECVTGLDLLEWQLRVAAGEKLPLTQEQITLDGHAIEVRLCAEDVAKGFMPQTGRVAFWQVADGEGLRIDHGLTTGTELTPHYDSMVAKLIAYGPNREVARTRLLAALANTQLCGVTSNRDFLASIVAHDAFASGAFDTGFIEQYFPAGAPGMQSGTQSELLPLAATALHFLDAQQLSQAAGFSASMANWRSCSPSPVTVLLDDGERVSELTLAVVDDEYSVTDGSQENTEPVWYSELILEGSELRYRQDGILRQAFVHRDGDRLWLSAGNSSIAARDATYDPPSIAGDGSDGRVCAPMDGRVIALRCEAGQTVSADDTLLVLEAMKMEMQIKAGCSGSVARIAVAEGDQVSMDQLLVEIAADENPDNGDSE